MDSLPSRLAVALAIGLLVGLERGWRSRGEEEKQRAAGLRTFALSGLLGGVSGVLGQEAGPVLLGLLFLGYTGVFAAFHWLEARATGDLGATSVVAGMLTFVLGAWAVMGDLDIAIGCAVAMTLLLALREPLHRWIAALRWEDIRAVLILLAMSFLLLPILPNRTIDPWDAVNPAKIWLLAILIASISFGGYVAVRVFGQRLGIVMAALAGGLTSSTATTLALARMGRGAGASVQPLAAGILLASVVMVARMGVITGLFRPSLLADLLLPLTAGGLAMAVTALALLLRAPDHPHPDLHAANPLELGTAIKLALAIGVIMMLSRAVQDQFGSAGLLLVAAVSGLVDVDAITVSVASMEGESLATSTAVHAIALAAGVNTVAKTAMVFWVGGTRLGRPVAVGSAAALVAAGAALLAL